MSGIWSLVMKLNHDGTLDTALMDRNIQGRRATSLMNDILWDQSISKTKKQRICNTIFKSILTYGSEVWQINQWSENMLLAAEMDFWRSSAGLSRRDRNLNGMIREIKETKHTIIDVIKTEQLIWYSGVQRMSNDRLPKQFLTLTP